MSNCDKMHLFTILALVIFGYRYDFQICFNIAFGFSGGAAIWYMLRFYIGIKEKLFAEKIYELEDE